MSGAARQTKGVPAFLLTTVRMLEEIPPSDGVCWAADGRSFVIESPEKFLKTLPRYFKTKNYSSFVRQLNMYGFHKVKNARGYQEFRHEFFVRGQPELLDRIRRKVSEPPSEAGETSDLRIIGHEKAHVEAKIIELNEMIAILRTQNVSLAATHMEMTRTFDECKRAIDERMSKLFFQFLALVQTWTPNVFEENKRLIRGRDGVNLERLFRPYPPDFMMSSPLWAPEDEKDRLSIGNFGGDPAASQVHNYLPFALQSPALMITDKSPESPPGFEGERLCNYSEPSVREFFRPNDDSFSDTLSVSSLRLGPRFKPEELAFPMPETGED